MFSGHFGHWELTAYVQGLLGMPLSMIVCPLDNPLVERMFARQREGAGNRVISKRPAAREMLRSVRDGGGVAILIDQDAHEGGVFVPFLGHPASTTPALARLALRTGAAVVPTFCIPEKHGRYRIVWEPPVEIELSGDRENDVRELTRRCSEILDSWVRRHPELWVWMHRRWKTPPPSSDILSTPPEAKKKCVEQS